MTLQNRRSFLATMGGSAGAALLAGGFGSLASGCTAKSTPPPRAFDRIGVQLYTLRGEMEKDVATTLERVASIGYREVEFAGYFGKSPAELRAIVDRHSLSAPAAHVPLEILENKWSEALAAANVLGHGYLVIPWLDLERRRTLDDYRRLAEILNRGAAQARDAGIRLAYHNHDFELVPLEGRLPYDVLLEATDPALVSFEMDLYWVTKAGGDPLAYITRYPGRFRLVHVKDSAGAPEHRITDVGKGSIDFSAIFARRNAAGIEHLFVEHDNPSDAFESIRSSYAHLAAMRV